MPVSIRTMSESDLGIADAVLRSAFQRSESWKHELNLFLTIQPDGVFLACQADTPAGMVATVIYSNYAYVGLMGVHQDFQGQGVGLALMQHVLVFMQQHGVSVIKLDASPDGQPLYEKLGFAPFEEVYVLQLQKCGSKYRYPQGVQALTLQDLDFLAASDHQVFGTDRSRLLQSLLQVYPGRAFMARDMQGRVCGYLFAQEKRIGPWIMNDREYAEPLLLAALSLPFPQGVSVVVPGWNEHAIALLERHGFKITRTNRHMVYGLDPQMGRRSSVYGQTSLSFG